MSDWIKPLWTTGMLVAAAKQKLLAGEDPVVVARFILRLEPYVDDNPWPRQVTTVETSGVV